MSFTGARIFGGGGRGLWRCFHGVRRFGDEVKASPPKLPKKEQEEFEKLQRVANSQMAIEEYNRQVGNAQGANGMRTDIGGFSPEYRGSAAEFEGEVNPKTGEVGGPKQDPLRHGDYSFNGRVTDF